MRKVLTVICCLFIHTISWQQGGDGTSPTIFNGVGDFKNLTQGINVTPVFFNQQGFNVTVNRRVEGNGFFISDWNWGWIRFDNKAVFDSVQLRFNCMTNYLHFLDKEKEYYLNSYYREFGFADTVNGEMKKFVFRNNFPAIEKNDAKTNYQFLAGGRYQLLKLITKSLTEPTGLDGQTYYKIIATEDYYIYNGADKTIKKLRKTVAALQADLPGLKDLIGEICTKEKLKCKSESDLVALFSAIALQHKQDK